MVNVHLVVDFLSNLVDFVAALPFKFGAEYCVDPAVDAIHDVFKDMKIFLFDIFAIFTEVEGSLCDCQLIPVPVIAGDEECSEAQNYSEQAANIGQHFVDFPYCSLI